jgi:hypothetical protein
VSIHIFYPEKYDLWLVIMIIMNTVGFHPEDEGHDLPHYMPHIPEDRVIFIGLGA